MGVDLDLGESVDHGVDGVRAFRLDLGSRQVDWIANYTVSDGLNSDFLTDIVADPQGQLWIPSDRGIYTLDYGADPADKTDDHLVLDTRFPNAHQIEFVSDSEALVANGALHRLQYNATVGNTSDDHVITYDVFNGLTAFVGSFSRNPSGVLALSGCSPKRLDCYLMGRAFASGLAERIVVEGSTPGLVFDFSPCSSLSFVRFGPDAASADDDEIWHMYRTPEIGCGKTFFPLLPE